MAKIDVRAIVTAPAEVTVPLIRADYAETANIFRVFFEIFLSIFASLLGYVLALSCRTAIDWIFLLVTGSAAIAFAVISFNYSRKAHKI